MSGMRTKTKEVYLATSRAEYDIYVFVETWLNSDFFDEEYFNPNLFQIYRKDRDAIKTGHRKGGGVLIAVKSCLRSSNIQLLDGDSLIDQLCVCIFGLARKLLVCVSYVPPISTDDLYSCHVNNIMHLVEHNENCNFCFLGDFNLTDLKWSYLQNNDILTPTNINRAHEIYFIDSLLSFNLIQINTFLIN